MRFNFAGRRKPLEKRGDGARVHAEACPEIAHRSSALREQFKKHEILRERQPQRLEEWLMQPRHPVRRAVQRERELVARTKPIRRELASVLRFSSVLFHSALHNRVRTAKFANLVSAGNWWVVRSRVRPINGS